MMYIQCGWFSEVVAMVTASEMTTTKKGSKRLVGIYPEPEEKVNYDQMEKWK